jgi:hypothetical protein
MSRETRSMLMTCTVAVALIWMTARGEADTPVDGYELLRTYTEALRFADNGYPRTSPGRTCPTLRRSWAIWWAGSMAIRWVPPCVSQSRTLP